MNSSNILTVLLSTAVSFADVVVVVLTLCKVEYSSMGNHIVRKELVTSHNPEKFLNTSNLFNKKPWCTPQVGIMFYPWPTLPGYVAQWLRICLPKPEMQEVRVQSPGREDPLEKDMITHCSILAWGIPLTESLAGYSPGGHEVRYDEHAAPSRPQAWHPLFPAVISFSRSALLWSLLCSRPFFPLLASLPITMKTVYSSAFLKDKLLTSLPPLFRSPEVMTSWWFMCISGEKCLATNSDTTEFQVRKSIAQDIISCWNFHKNY